MYKLIKDSRGGAPSCVCHIPTSVYFQISPPSIDNTDYQEYLRWLAQGNQPLPADEQQGVSNG